MQEKEKGSLQYSCEKIFAMNQRIHELQEQRDGLIQRIITEGKHKEFEEAYKQHELDMKEVDEFLNDPAWANVGRGEI